MQDAQEGSLGGGGAAGEGQGMGFGRDLVPVPDEWLGLGGGNGDLLEPLQSDADDNDMESLASGGANSPHTLNIMRGGANPPHAPSPPGYPVGNWNLGVTPTHDLLPLPPSQTLPGGRGSSGGAWSAMSEDCAGLHVRVQPILDVALEPILIHTPPALLPMGGGAHVPPSAMDMSHGTSHDPSPPPVSQVAGATHGGGGGGQMGLQQLMQTLFSIQVCQSLDPG